MRFSTRVQTFVLMLIVSCVFPYSALVAEPVRLEQAQKAADTFLSKQAARILGGSGLLLKTQPPRLPAPAPPEPAFFPQTNRVNPPKIVHSSESSFKYTRFLAQNRRFAKNFHFFQEKGKKDINISGFSYALRYRRWPSTCWTAPGGAKGGAGQSKSEAGIDKRIQARKC